MRAFGWRAARRIGVLALSGLAACLRPTPAPAPPEALPRRLVLALDGVDYRDVVAARARGLFADFHAPSRLVSTFPSISDVAWHDIFGVMPPAGYQRVFFSRTANAVVGSALDAIAPIEYEERMDLAFGGRFHHLSAYLISEKIAKQEVDDAIAAFWRTSDRRTLYVYNVGPDALQHTNGKLRAYLEHLDAELRELQIAYRARTGRALEIVLLSDHGHNRATQARFIPLVDTLSARGFQVRGRLEAPTDVALSVDGVTTGFGVFCAEDSVESVATALLATPGIELVTTRHRDGRIHVRRASDSTDAWIDRDTTSARLRLRYRPGHGDPLEHRSIVNALRASGHLDHDGFADDSAWTRASMTTRYPAALPRIVHGHTTITLNPAPILVSVAVDARVGFGFVSVANRLRPLGGTHGALDSTSALGVAMTNFRPTHDDLTHTVRTQFDGFADLAAPHVRAPSARLTSGSRLMADPRGPFRGVALPDDALGPGVLVQLRYASDDRA
nr:hypothetical protein [Gemmatimonadaceae bacterium]